MRVLSAQDLSGIFAFPPLIEALREAFQAGAAVPDRQHHRIARPGEPDATLLLMPAWHDASAGDGGPRFLGVKIVALVPGNASRGKPTLSGSFLLMSGATGEPVALLDGAALTLWRTAAASALAATYLARRDASRLVMVGSGALAPYLVAAHASVRPISEVLIWNRNFSHAEALAAEMVGRPFSAAATEDIETAVRAADVVSCATLSRKPLVRGAWLKAGAHLDLVGGFTPEMRESDDEAVRRARLYVDTRAGALREAGDLLIPFRAGVRSEGDVVGDLFQLCRGEAEGRRSDAEITLFKSVGTALEDLAAAAHALRLVEGRL